MRFDRAFCDLTAKDVMTLHLKSRNLQSSTKDGLILSTLGVIYQEARSAMWNAHTCNIIPLIGAFSALDQLGNCYRNTALDQYPDDNASGIKKCLYYFGDFEANDDKTKALYALRNCLIHDASLANTKQGQERCFQYGDAEEIVLLPTESWDGQMVNISSNNTTIVNPHKIIELAGKCIDKASDLLDSGDLEITLEQGFVMLKLKYLQFIPKITDN